MFPLILALLPAIPHIVLGVEKLFGRGNGATKKQAAVSMLSDLVNAFGAASGAGANSSEMTLIDALLEATVKYLNDTGVMTHAAVKR